MSAQVICFASQRLKNDDTLEIDLSTAVDVAIRDLVEIEATWGTTQALKRLLECRAMLQSAFAAPL